MKESILNVLARGELIIGDGAMGTMLQAKGLTSGTLPEIWNAEHAELVTQVHRAYLDAGSQIITTNTFGGNRLLMEKKGMAERSAELTRLGASLAKDVAGDRAWVAGSVGPTGELIKPIGTLSITTAEEVFAEQVEALAEGGADLILIETQHDIEEACAAVRMAATRTALPVFCTFAFNPKGFTMMGLNPQEAAVRAKEAGADVVIMAQSNAGLPKIGENDETIWDFSPEEMVEYARIFVSLGATVVGGCCGTRPAHIAAIAAALRA
jgi:5-methyltetrahydrofolate--homocysteine methyltransferase